MIKEYLTKSGVRYKVGIMCRGRSFRRSGLKSREEAESLQRRFLKGEGENVVLSFHDVIREYLSYYCRSVKDSTANNIGYYFNKHIFPYTPDKPFSAVTRRDIEEWWNYIKRSPLVQKNRYLSWMKNIFKFGFDVYGIDNKACSLIIPYHDYSIKKDFMNSKSISNEEFLRFMSFVDDDYYRLAFLMGYFLGLRISELRGLQVEALQDDRLYIYQQIRPYGESVVYSLKSKNSQRYYILPSFLLERLRKHIAVNGLVSTDFIFFGLRSHDLPISETSFNRKLKNYCEKAGMRGMTFHYFRHSDASTIFNSGLPLNIIKDYLGHSSEEVTKRYYINQNESDKRTVAKLQESIYESMKKAR